MTTIATNTVSGAANANTGVGSFAHLGTLQTDYATDIAFGDIVDAAALKLRHSGSHSFAPDPALSTSIGTVIETGSWRCLGYMPLGHSGVTRASSLFQKVAE